MESESTISKFFANKKVFITGATGFIGKAIVWKLLQSCPLVDKIYVLIRSKREDNVERRLNAMLNSLVFDKFRSENPEILNKVVAVSGSIDGENLHISDVDEKLLQDEVDVVFHIAALLKMDATLKQAVEVNVEGTLTLLKLCTTMKNLSAFVYVSTAYCYCDKDTTEEKVYPARQHFSDVINLVRWMDHDLLELITPKLLASHPNTYTYSKRQAENVVSDFFPRLPVVIARPSIVIASLNEPVPGWTDNHNGIGGIFLTTGKGILRSMHCIGENTADLISVDIVCNGLLAIAWKTAIETEKIKETLVYNIPMTETKPITWNDVLNLSLPINRKYPFKIMLWYPELTFYKCKYMNIISTFFLQWIPAYIIDFVLLAAGQKRFMVHVQKKVALGTTLLSYFTNHTWHFANDNILRLKESMTVVDRKIFPVTMTVLSNDREKFIKDSLIFGRNFFGKEDMSTLPAARRNLKILFVLNVIVQILFCCFVAYLLYSVGAMCARLF